MANKFLVATFLNPADVVEAVRAVRREKFRVYDVYTPYPIHHLDQAMGLRKTRLPMVALLGALAGLTLAAGLQFYTSALDWPMNVGGKPDASTLAFIPISFELTVLFSALTVVAALLVRSRLFPGRHEPLIARGITDSTFALVLRQRPALDAVRARALLKGCGALSIEERAANL
jgi:hypothetical protein